MRDNDNPQATVMLPLEGPRPVCACGHSRTMHNQQMRDEPCTILACGCKVYRRDYDEWLLRVKVRVPAEAPAPSPRQVLDALAQP